MRISEISRLLLFSKQRVYRLVVSGRLIGRVKQGKFYEIEPKDFEAFMTRCNPPACQIACLLKL